MVILLLVDTGSSFPVIMMVYAGQESIETAIIQIFHEFSLQLPLKQAHLL
ncbi:hypothetical protein ASZ90_018195 [hydrocarbon metagenome]|uniref:Uncharacterized protein n=1 Tax=hydrocarbon metagenome TaxID=938273 RepID=A0A0W8E756_9ZZZZ